MLYEVPLSRVNEMAAVAAEAFIGANDPMGNFMFQNEPNHLALKKRVFSSLVKCCSPEAMRHAISPSMEAVSIWFPPGVGHSEDVNTDPFKPEDFIDCDTMERIHAVNEAISALTKHLGTEPQWYLHLVAVLPHCMGRGYASLLIRPMLLRAEKESYPCTLITQRMENVRKYEHFGFKILEDMPVDDSGEKFYSMRKD